MSFWRTFGFHNANSIETILDRGDYTLDELLEEEEILQECKAQNKRLLDFLIEPEQLARLFEYITQEAEEQDPKRKFKYPYISCEILVSEVEPILNAVFNSPELIERLFNFLDNKPPLNPLLANYVSRVTMLLLDKKPKEMIGLMKKQKNIIDKFLTHLGTTTVMDLLLKLISTEDVEGGILQWLREGNLIRALVDKFDPSHDSEVHEHASQALVDIISASTNKNTPLMDELESEDTLRRLFQYILDERSKSSLIYGLTVVIELLRRNAKSTHDSVAKLTDLSPVFQVTVQHIPPLIKLLLSSNSSKMKTTIGEIEPFGSHRLRILEFFLALVQTNYRCIDEVLINLDTFTHCLDVFFRFPWNNFMHATIEQIIKAIFTRENDELKHSLLIQSKLLDRLMEAYKAAQEDLLKPKGVQKGYIGHLAKIVSIVSDNTKSSESFQKILKEHKDWQEFAPKIIEDLKSVETKPLGGTRPSNPGLSGLGGLGSFGGFGGGISASMFMGTFGGLLRSLNSVSSESQFSFLREGSNSGNTANTNEESNNLNEDEYNDDEDDSDDDETMNELDFSFPEDFGQKETQENEEREVKMETQDETEFENADIIQAENAFDSIFQSSPNEDSDEEEEEETDVRIVERPNINDTPPPVSQTESNREMTESNKLQETKMEEVNHEQNGDHKVEETTPLESSKKPSNETSESPPLSNPSNPESNKDEKVEVFASP